MSSGTGFKGPPGALWSPTGMILRRGAAHGPERFLSVLLLRHLAALDRRLAVACAQRESHGPPPGRAAASREPGAPLRCGGALGGSVRPGTLAHGARPPRFAMEDLVWARRRPDPFWSAVHDLGARLSRAQLEFRGCRQGRSRVGHWWSI